LGISCSSARSPARGLANVARPRATRTEWLARSSRACGGHACSPRKSRRGLGVGADDCVSSGARGLRKPTRTLGPMWKAKVRRATLRACGSRAAVARVARSAGFHRHRAGSAVDALVSAS